MAVAAAVAVAVTRWLRQWQRPWPMAGRLWLWLGHSDRQFAVPSLTDYPVVALAFGAEAFNALG